MPLHRSRRASFIAATLLACTALAACGGSSVVAPSTANNAALLQQFATQMAKADSDSDYVRAGEYVLIMQTLSLGSPVNQVDISVGGRKLRFSASAGMLVQNDSAGNPVDSAYSFAAWRGANKDTLVVMEYYMSPGIGPNRVGAQGIDLSRVLAPPAGPAASGISASISGVIWVPSAFVVLTEDANDWAAAPDSATASVQQTSVGSSCTSFTSPVPLGLPTVGVECLQNRATVSFSANVAAAGGSATGSQPVSLDATGVSGVRLAITP